MNFTTRRRFLCAFGGLAACGSIGIWSSRSSGDMQALSPSTFTRSGTALGTKVTLTVVHDHAETARRALAAGFEALEHVEDLMSIYRPRSQLSRLNRDRILRDPHPDLVTVLTAAEDLSRRTDGAFDITVQPLWSLSANAAKAGRIPTDQEVAAARERVDWKAVEVTARSVRLHGPGTQITLNGIAQGYAVDWVSETLRRHGIQHALIDTGEIAGVGHKSSREPWRVGIQDPRIADAYAAVANLNDRCLATSGDYSTTFNPGLTEHHIFDPRTGRSPSEIASVSVVAANGMWADGLSTAVFILGIEAGSQLLATIPNAAAFFITKTGQTIATPGFPDTA
ncbi:MAG: ApbE family lipoprotein [Planctomycetaceae bacterium]|nr:ApbE family lipoprotein [Planctomycetaceae bacterium]